MKERASLDEIERAIADADPETQKRFLSHLPHLLKLSAAELEFLKAAESAFEFWDNPDDRIYDRL